MKDEIDAWRQRPRDVVPKTPHATDASALEALEGQEVDLTWTEFTEDVDGIPTGVQRHTERATLGPIFNPKGHHHD